MALQEMRAANGNVAVAKYLMRGKIERRPARITIGSLKLKTFFRHYLLAIKES